MFFRDDKNGYGDAGCTRQSQRDDEGFGQFFQGQRLVAGEAANFGQLGQGNGGHTRAGGNDEMFRCDLTAIVKGGEPVVGSRAPDYE